MSRPAQSELVRILAIGGLVLFGATAAVPGGHSASSASQASQPDLTSTPSPESETAPEVAIQFGSAAGEVPARAAAVAEAQASGVDLTISPNQDGWPDFNPLIMQLTLTCPAGGPNCASFLLVKIYSNDGARFWLYGAPDEPECGCGQIFEESGPYSLRGYSAFSASVSVPAGAQRRLYWSLWIQPSSASTLFVEATWFGTNQFLIAMEQMRIHPLIFIPGILGTMPPTFSGIMDPVIGIYEPLFVHLQKTGYVLDQTLFPFPVDWRRSILVAAQRLEEGIPGFLERANQLDYVGEPTSAHPATKVDLVVHSMGGLITRAYVEGAGYRGDIHKVVFIASPHRGFPEAYKTWEGLTWESFLYEGYHSALRLAMDHYLWPSWIGKLYGPSEEEKQAAGCGSGPDGTLPYITCSRAALFNWSHDPTRGTLSLLEMLPDESWGAYLLCGDHSGVECEPLSAFPFGNDPNPLLGGAGGLNAPHRLQALADRLGPENMYVIYGSGTLTDGGYLVRRGAPPPWVHGVPLDPWYVDGDDLIPTVSANLSVLLPQIPAANVVELFGPTARHKEIMYNPEVLMWHVPGFLTGTAGFAPEGYTPTIPINIGTESMLVFTLICPVNLTVTDPLGRQVGFDPVSGGSLQEIPGTIYAAPNSEGQFIIVASPETGKYQVSGVAFADGEYLLSVIRQDPEGFTILESFSGSVTLGDELHFEVDNPPDVPPTPTPTATESPTGTETPTSIPTEMPTNTPTPTVTFTPTATATPTLTLSVIEALDKLKKDIEDYGEAGQIGEQLEGSLLAKVRTARLHVQHGREAAAAHRLEALVDQIEEQRGKRISRPAARNLIAQAEAILDRLVDDEGEDAEHGR